MAYLKPEKKQATAAAPHVESIKKILADMRNEEAPRKKKKKKEEDEHDDDALELADRPVQITGKY